MHLLTEMHSVEIAHGGERHLVATADLCSDDDTLENLRSRVVTIGGGYFRIADRDALGHAFDEAFDRCEAKPGADVVGTHAFGEGQVIITRRLAA